jgi:hypothetical protein
LFIWHILTETYRVGLTPGCAVGLIDHALWSNQIAAKVFEPAGVSCVSDDIKRVVFVRIIRYAVAVLF